MFLIPTINSVTIISPSSVFFFISVEQEGAVGYTRL